MDSVYLISLIVGGFFVLLSIFGGSEGASDSDADADVDVDADADLDADTDVDPGVDVSADHDLAAHDLGGDMGHGPDFVDLLSLRALFLFAAFFGLTGISLSWLGSQEPLTAIIAVLTGLIIGLGGNYAIKRFAYEQVSSAIGLVDMQGHTAKVLVPFEGSERGKIQLQAKGQRIQLLARSVSDESAEIFSPGDEVVVVRMDGRVAEVVKPE